MTRQLKAYIRAHGTTERVHRPPYRNGDTNDESLADIGWVYLMKAGPFYKVGKTDNPTARVRSIQSSCPYPVEFMGAIFVGDATSEEIGWHGQLLEYHFHGEWFELPQEIVDAMLEVMDVRWEDIQVMNPKSVIEAYRVGSGDVS